MSKSLGNSVEPQDVIQPERGRDPAPVGGAGRLLRGPADRPHDPADHHRRLPQAAQHAALPAGRAGRLRRRPSASTLADMPPLERFILHRLWELDGQVRGCLRGATASRTPVRGRWRDFCSNDLSALFFDIRRDVLYCDRPDSPAPPRLPHGDGPGVRAADRLAGARSSPSPWRRPGRRASRTPAPTRCGVFPRDAGATGATRPRPSAGRKVERGDPRGHRRAGDRAAREAHRRGAGGRAAWSASPIPTCWRRSMASTRPRCSAPARRSAGRRRGSGGRLPPAEVAGVAVEPLQAEGRKCARSWRILPEVGADPRYPDLSCATPTPSPGGTRPMADRRAEPQVNRNGWVAFGLGRGRGHRRPVGQGLAARRLRPDRSRADPGAAGLQADQRLEPRRRFRAAARPRRPWTLAAGRFRRLRRDRALALWVRRAERLLTAAAIGLIIGGAIGNNVIDRVRWGRVFDYLDFGALHFPWVFNVADTAISVGVGAARSRQPGRRAPPRDRVTGWRRAGGMRYRGRKGRSSREHKDR